LVGEAHERRFASASRSAQHATGVVWQFECRGGVGLRRSAFEKRTMGAEIGPPARLGRKRICTCQQEGSRRATNRRPARMLRLEWKSVLQIGALERQFP
jgi:hypothetical protein